MELVHADLSFQVIGALFEVHNEIGGGHKEKIYQKALAVCLARRNVPFKEQVKTDLKMHGVSVGTYFLDFLIDDKIILEIKASSFFKISDFRQATAYLTATKLQLALLAVFTPATLRYRRVVNIR